MSVKFYLWMAVSLISVHCVISSAQSQPRPAEYPSKGVPTSQWLRSRQGQSTQPDVIAHHKIMNGAHLACTQVEHHPKSPDDGAACVLRFADGSKMTLRFGQESKAPIDGEVYLECAGDKPTSCTAIWW